MCAGAGQYGDAKGALKCKLCPKGKYNVALETAKPLLAGQDEYLQKELEMRSLRCAPCRQGYFSEVGWQRCKQIMRVTDAPTSFPTVRYDPKNCDALSIHGLSKEGALVPRNPEGCMGIWYYERDAKGLKYLYEANMQTPSTKPIYTRKYTHNNKCGKAAHGHLMPIDYFFAGKSAGLKFLYYDPNTNVRFHICFARFH
jgi:hypothetical protein